MKPILSLDVFPSFKSPEHLCIYSSELNKDEIEKCIANEEKIHLVYQTDVIYDEHLDLSKIMDDLYHPTIFAFDVGGNAVICCQMKPPTSTSIH